MFHRKKNRKLESMKRHPSYVAPLEVTKINNSTFYVNTSRFRRDSA